MSLDYFRSNDLLMSNPNLESYNLQLIRDALDDYAKQMKIDLKDNPFAEELKDCNSPDAILQLLEKNRDDFKDYRKKDRKFIDCLNPVVKFVHAFSDVLGEAASLVSAERSLRSTMIHIHFLLHQVPFQPAKLVFVGIDVLFTVGFALDLINQHRPLISCHIRRPKESARATTLSSNSLNASEASSNASKYIRRSL